MIFEQSSVHGAGTNVGHCNFTPFYAITDENTSNSIS